MNLLTVKQERNIVRKLHLNNMLNLDQLFYPIKDVDKLKNNFNSKIKTIWSL